VVLIEDICRMGEVLDVLLGDVWHHLSTLPGFEVGDPNHAFKTVLIVRDQLQKLLVFVLEPHPEVKAHCLC